MTDTLETCAQCGGSGHFDPTNTTDYREYGRECPSCLGVGRVPTETVIKAASRAIGKTYRGIGEQSNPLYWEDEARAAVQAYLKETL